MELEMSEVMQTLNAGLERLSAAANALEQSAARLEQSGEVQKITAAVEGGVEITARELELERRLAQAEQTIAALEAGAAAGPTSSRKTLPTATVHLLAKQGIEAGESVDVHSLDAALTGLSVEQRIAVKSQMMRTGSLTL